MNKTVLILFVATVLLGVFVSYVFIKLQNNLLYIHLIHSAKLKTMGKAMHRAMDRVVTPVVEMEIGETMVQAMV